MGRQEGEEAWRNELEDGGGVAERGARKTDENETSKLGGKEARRGDLQEPMEMTERAGREGEVDMQEMARNAEEVLVGDAKDVEGNLPTLFESASSVWSTLLHTWRIRSARSTRDFILVVSLRAR